MKFSIITVTRNNLDGLKNTAESLQWQTCRDFEWIVIDGASTDGTPPYLDKTDARWISEPDKGIYDAMNKGIDRARGDYVLFLNAGDTLAVPDVLEKIDVMIEDEDFIYGDSIEGDHIKPARPHTQILTGLITHHQAILYRRARLGALRYDQRFKIAGDYRLTLEFLRLPGIRALYCPFPVCIFEQGGVSQVQFRRGRIEQFIIRRELRACPLAINIWVFAGQSAMMAVRRAWPRLYWWLKRTK